MLKRQMQALCLFVGCGLMHTQGEFDLWDAGAFLAVALALWNCVRGICLPGEIAA